MVEVEHGRGAFLEAVLVDVPQPHAAVYDEEDGLGAQGPHPIYLALQSDDELVRGGVLRDRHDALMMALRFPLTASSADSLKTTAERISCLWTCSESLLFFLSTPQL